MLYVKTERIWSITGNDVYPREGTIALEKDQMISNEHDITGVLHVASGIHAADLAIFLSFEDIESPELPTDIIGYLVTHAEDDGTGILVGGDRFDQDPASWLTPRIITMWDYLRAEGYTPAELELNALAAHLEGIRIRNDAT